jgi:hypothetical protein
VYIFTCPGLVACRWRPLSSNVRLHAKTFGGASSSKCSAQRRSMENHETAEPQKELGSDSRFTAATTSTGNGLRLGLDSHGLDFAFSCQRFAAKNCGH